MKEGGRGRQRWRLTIEYQGTRYRGWQGQKNARTVQGELLGAARRVLGGDADIQGAGRTDAGVHALGQVAHLDAAGGIEEVKLLRSLNDLLPMDINILRVERADSRFHARHHAKSRSYLYQISRRRTALGKNLVWWVKDHLDFPAMRRSAGGLEGMRDFASFCDRRMEAERSTMVLLEKAELVEAGELILVRLRASHFLWKMVRRIVGVLAQVGRGELSPDEFRRLLEVPSDYPAAHTAPPSGLFLEEVIYAGDEFQRPLVPVIEVPPASPRSGGPERRRR